MSIGNRTEKVPAALKETFEKIVAITEVFCKKYLNDEYALLARQAIAALCRKRSFSFSEQRLNSLACGVVYALGIVNFLFDKTQSPHMKATDLCQAFAVSKSTGKAKANMVLALLKTGQFDTTWILPSRLDDHPMAWMIMFNGYIIDIRQLPKEVQIMAYQKGIIHKLPP